MLKTIFIKVDSKTLLHRAYNHEIILQTHKSTKLDKSKVGLDIYNNIDGMINSESQLPDKLLNS